MNKFLTAALAGGLLFAAGPAFADETSAVSVISPTPGNSARGTVWFVEDGDDLRVVADIQGLAPNQRHGFHVHELGNRENPGEHFNPESEDHAGPHDATRHAGDLGNLEADSNGRARLDITVEDLSVDERNAIMGRSVVVHANRDDLSSEPSGGSGPRIGVGLIQTASTADIERMNAFLDDDDEFEIVFDRDMEYLVGDPNAGMRNTTPSLTGSVRTGLQDESEFLEEDEEDEEDVEVMTIQRSDADLESINLRMDDGLGADYDASLDVSTEESMTVESEAEVEVVERREIRTEETTVITDREEVETTTVGTPPPDYEEDQSLEIRTRDMVDEKDLP